MSNRLVSRWTEENTEAGLAILRGTGVSEPFGKTEDGNLDLRGIPIHGPFRPDGVELRQADFSGMQADNRVIFANSKLIDCRFDTARVRWGDHCSSFELLSFKGAKLAGSGFGSNYVGCDFSNANISGSTGLKPTFTNCLFDQTNFKDSVMRDCSFIDCKFAGKINGVIFGGDFGLMKGCDMVHASFIDCTFNGFRFENCSTSQDTLVFSDWPSVLEQFTARLNSEPSPELVAAGRKWHSVWTENLDITGDYLVDFADLRHFEGSAVGTKLFRILDSIRSQRG